MPRLPNRGKGYKERNRDVERALAQDTGSIDEIREELAFLPERTHSYDFGSLENLLDSMIIDAQEAYHR